MTTHPSTHALLPVHQAEQMILEHALPCPSEDCALEGAIGCCLREPVRADRDLPPFDRVTMDGIAIDTKGWEQGVRAFRVQGVQAAGEPAHALEDTTACFKVMTGAVLPKRANCVIPREEVEFQDDTATVKDDAKLASGQFIHVNGADARKGDVLLESGTRIGPHHVLIAASVGATTVKVAQPPSVAVISNGDELVPVSATPEPHQIRQSNAHALEAALRTDGANLVERFHYPDDRQAMLDGVGDLLARYDTLILSGGVSAGDYDYMPQVLESLGVQKQFHKVQQRPGKPFWFGVGPGNVPVFALPGNPVSTLVCYHRFIRPWLFRSLGAQPEDPPMAELATAVDFPPPLTYFLQVRIRKGPGGHASAEPASHHGSGDYASLASTDGFVELEAATTHFPMGFSAPFYPWS